MPFFVSTTDDIVVDGADATTQSCIVVEPRAPEHEADRVGARSNSSVVPQNFFTESGLPGPRRGGDDSSPYCLDEAFMNPCVEYEDAIAIDSPWRRRSQDSGRPAGKATRLCNLDQPLISVFKERSTRLRTDVPRTSSTGTPEWFTSTATSPFALPEESPQAPPHLPRAGLDTHRTNALGAPKFLRI